MTLFQIDGHDYTAYILNPTYSVNSVPVFSEWVDANYITHREVYRTRVSGSFQMRFFKQQDIDLFFMRLGNVKSTGLRQNAYKITVYVSNDKEAREIEAFLNPQPSLIRYAHGGINYAAFDVVLEEA